MIRTPQQIAENLTIPLHVLTDRTNLGLEIHRIDMKDMEVPSTLGVHRDDHYIFIFQQAGQSTMMVDFREVLLEEHTVFCVLPGQVHHSLSAKMASGWFLALDLAVVDESFRSIFEAYAVQATPVAVEKQTGEMLHKSLLLLFDMITCQQDLPFQNQILRSLIQVCAGTFASVFHQYKQDKAPSNSRPATICSTFKRMVIEKYKTIKSPAEYAGILNITSSYLNEVVKNVTGFSVTYWIQQEVILEAKRLLYYTDLTVKAISFELGYEDPAYFSRLFHKVVHLTPLAFRKQYRD